MGLVAAVECWVLRREHAAEEREVRRRLHAIEASAVEACGGPGVLRCSYPRGLDGAPRAYITNRLRIEWDSAGTQDAPAAVADALLAGNPAVAVIETKSGLDICAHFLEAGEEVLVADRLASALHELVAVTAAAAAAPIARL